MHSSSISPDFAKALVAVQGSIEGAVKGSTNPHFRSKYADLGACWDACRDALQANGIAVLQFPVEAESGFVGLRSTLVYGPTGETFAESYRLPVKDSTNPQAFGSAITYARRYALCSIVGVCPVDDDGQAATKAPKATVDPDKPVPYRVTPGPNKEVWGWTETFARATTRDGMKEVYSQLKNSNHPEPDKTNLLLTFAQRIKEMPADSTKGVK